MHGPKNVVLVMLALIVLQMAFVDYWSYSRAFHEDPKSFVDVLERTAQAPAQYRIGVLVPAGFIMRHSPLGLRHILSATDLAMGGIAVLALFFLFEQSSAYRRSSLSGQWFGAAAFALLVQFYLP